MHQYVKRTRQQLQIVYQNRDEDPQAWRQKNALNFADPLYLQTWTHVGVAWSGGDLFTSTKRAV